MSETQVSLSTTEKLGLLPEEFEQIKELLGRTPNFIELSIFSVMWSEHYSHKNSLLQLKTLAIAGEEGVGLIDLGNGYALTIKMESHNQTSGAGVAGIHRGIISKGGRPIATLNSLRFGDIDLPDTQNSLKEVVKGIGACGNSIGVPTVGGDLYFDPCYNANPLVNTLSIGIMKKGHSSNAPAIGIGNPVFMVGAATGRERKFGLLSNLGEAKEGSEEKSSSAQAEAPFTEKLLLEATLEALETGAIVGVRDMGAAGICTATSELAAKGKVGMDVWLDKVPLRQHDILPVEILLSDSSGRMLFVVETEKEQLFLDVCEKWDLNCTQIGKVTDSGKLRYQMNAELLGEIPVEVLVQGSGAPVYERAQKEPAYMAEVRAFDPQSIIEPIEHDRVIRHLLEQVSIASKGWVVEQYDSQLEDSKIPSHIPADAAILKMQGMKTKIVVSADCNSRYVHADPEKGAMLAVSEAARNIACTGGRPLGVSNCLNFGDPYNPEVYFQFAQAIKGVGAACRKFDTSITDANVSLYNESENGPIFPTPMIGMLGVIEDTHEGGMSMDFKAKGDQIYLLGKVVEDLGSSEYVYSYHQRKLSPAPYVNLDEEHLLQQILLKLIAEKAISSAHDISDGGLIVSMLESAFVNEMGFNLKCPEGIRKDAFLYGESGGRAIVSVATAQLAKFVSITAAAGIDATHLGTVTGEHIVIDGQKMAEIYEYKRLYNRALPKKLDP